MGAAKFRQFGRGQVAPFWVWPGAAILSVAKCRHFGRGHFGRGHFDPHSGGCPHPGRVPWACPDPSPPPGATRSPPGTPRARGRASGAGAAAPKPRLPIGGERRGRARPRPGPRPGRATPSPATPEAAAPLRVPPRGRRGVAVTPAVSTGAFWGDLPKFWGVLVGSLLILGDSSSHWGSPRSFAGWNFGNLKILEILEFGIFEF